MTAAAKQQTWRYLSEQLTDAQQGGFQRVFPDDSSRRSLVDGIGDEEVAATSEQLQRGQRLSESTTQLLRQLDAASDISRCPIMAITGQLNAGKSSLLATYLSATNRQRVLRGQSNRAGTHRYVLWLPEIWWRDRELLSTLVSYLTTLFGHPPEHLSSDPEAAALQYNGTVLAESLAHPPQAQGDSAAQPAATTLHAPSAAPSDHGDTPTGNPSAINPMCVPLIAYDASLDDLKLGLVDCPDIQTGFVGGSAAFAKGGSLAASRQGLLAKVGRLCSAFVVVCRLSSLHDESLVQLLTTLRDTMPGVPRMLAVNRVKARYNPEVVYEQALPLCDRFGISKVFAAYDFRSLLASKRIPLLPQQMAQPTDRESLPIFVRTSLEPDSEEPVEYLFELGRQLDVGVLAQESSRSLQLQLKSNTLAIIEWIGNNVALTGQRTTDAQRAIADACFEFMAQRDASGKQVGLRLQASPAIVAQMAESLQRTAPAWMRVSLGIDKTMRQLHQALANSAARFQVLQQASKSVSQFAKRFRRGEGAQVVTPQRLAERIRKFDAHDAFINVTEEQLIADCAAAITRFSAEDKARLDDAELDSWSRQVWQNMSLKDKLWKGTQPLAVMLAPLLAAVLVPIDGGGTAVLVFASTKELLAAAGIAAVMTPMATGGETLSIVHRETPWRQLSDLFAICLDCVGVPRPPPTELPTATCDGKSRRLLDSQTETKVKDSEVAISWWRVPEEVLVQIESLANQLGTNAT